MKNSAPIGAAILLALGLAAGAVGAPPPPLEPGDANGDGVIDSLDVQAVANQLLGLSAAPGRPDCNQDGKVDVADLLCILAKRVPVDPALVAPPLPPGVPSSFLDQIRFLFEGVDPIQTGVAPGTIKLETAAAVRGIVYDEAGAPLPSVVLTIMGHPELGQTVSRADGAFDMAVNGGGRLCVVYRAPGLLVVHRAMEVPVARYTWYPDAALMARDANVTSVDLANPSGQVAQGSMMTDADGSRQATLAFDAGTTAAMVMGDGSSHPISSLSVRATEFTVGAMGQMKMPADLPASSAYTYCVEFGADEADAAGATTVEFGKPVTAYLENFLAFPVGVKAPLGAYDRKAGKWVGAPDGRVVKIVSISSGMADLDTDGDGNADNDPALGITDAERTRLAGLYSVGQELTRIQVTHFTPWDVNFPFGPPPGARPPDPLDPLIYSPLPNRIKKGDPIEPESQTLSRDVDILDTPYRLHYESDRSAGNKAANRIVIPVSGDSVPAPLIRIDLEISVAGQMIMQSFMPLPNLSYTLEWDGKDAYGRPLAGQQDVTIRIGNVFPGAYYQPGQTRSAFGLPAGVTISGSKTRGEITFWLARKSSVGASTDQRPLGLGGWNLDVHHVYDPGARILYLGDGGMRIGSALGAAMKTVAGGGHPADFIGDGLPATQAYLTGPQSCVVGPDGSLFISDYNTGRIRRVGLDGIISTYAGGGAPADGFGDGLPGPQAALSEPWGISLGPDGSLYIGESQSGRIRKVGPDGIISTVAGGGNPPDGLGDGLPATEAYLNVPFGAVVASDGSLFISENYGHRIRRVDPNGVIETFAGGGNPPDGLGDGLPAIQAKLAYPEEIAVFADGSVYISDVAHNRIRRVGVDGVITTAAGISSGGYSGDGGPATLAKLSGPSGVTPDGAGGFFLADYGNDLIRQVHADGTITRFAGVQGSPFPPYGAPTADGAPPLLTSLQGAARIHAGPDGQLYVAELNGGLVRTISPPMPGFTVDDVLIPSDGAIEYYVIHKGRHVRTAHGLTNGTLYAFDYDAQGRLTSVTDGDGLATTIDRDGSGAPVSITAPTGRKTLLALDANGWLASAQNPAGVTENFSYTADGLLTGRVDQVGNIFSSSYDALGRLAQDNYADGSSVSLSIAESPTSATVTLTTALGRVRKFRNEFAPGQSPRRIFTAPDGSAETMTSNPDGSSVLDFEDGASTTLAAGPDPRWKMAAPVLAKRKLRLPSGAEVEMDAARSATLADPNDPLSLATLADQFTMNGATATSVYDAATLRLTKTSAAGRVTTLDIDALGRIVRTQFGGLAATTYVYYSRGRLSQVLQGGRTTQFIYDSLDRPAQIVDPVGRTTTLAFDAANRVTSVDGPNGALYSQSYDAAGERTAVSPPGRAATTYLYTGVGLVSASTPPVGGGAGYSYNADQQMTTIAKPGGVMDTLNYDSAARLASVNADGRATTYGYDLAKGGLTTISSADGVDLAYTFDGPKIARVDWSGPVTGYVARAYDANFRLGSIDVGAPTTISYGYDDDGLVTQAGPLAIARDAATGLPVQTAMGDALTSQTHDAFGAPLAFEVRVSGTPQYLFRLERDGLGRIARMTETVQGTTRAVDYGYDTGDRLESVAVDSASSESYAYDLLGNRTSGSAPGGGGSATYDAEDRLIAYGGETFEYRADGALTTRTLSGQSTSYLHDSRGHLLAADLPGGKHIQYLLDGKNRRVGKKVNGALAQGFLYIDDLHPVAELDGAGAIVSLFAYDDWNNAPATMRKGGVDYLLVADPVGSVRLVINTSTGALAQRIDYDAFGNVLADSNPGFQPFGFAGGIYDADTGLTHFGQREYDARVGRWIERDPIGFGGGLNLYQYAMANPANFLDPGGLKPKYDPLWGGNDPRGEVDYVGVNVGASFFLGLNLNLSVSRHGAVVFTPSLTLGSPGVGGSIVAGKISPNPFRDPLYVTREDEEDVLTGTSYGGSGGFGFGGGVNYSPSANNGEGRTSVESGIYTPGAGVQIGDGIQLNASASTTPAQSAYLDPNLKTLGIAIVAPPGSRY